MYFYFCSPFNKKKTNIFDNTVRLLICFDGLKSAYLIMRTSCFCKMCHDLQTFLFKKIKNKSPVDRELCCTWKQELMKNLMTWWKHVKQSQLRAASFLYANPSKRIRINLCLHSQINNSAIIVSSCISSIRFVLKSLNRVKIGIIGAHHFISFLIRSGFKAASVSERFPLTDLETFTDHTARYTLEQLTVTAWLSGACMDKSKD